MSEGTSAEKSVKRRLVFESYPIPKGASLTAALPAKVAVRSGIYVLKFIDGMEYVGLSTKVTGRFSQHRRNWAKIAQQNPNLPGEIVAVLFSPMDLPDAELRQVEREVIAEFEACGSRLRNKAHVGFPLDTSGLEIIVGPDVLQAWQLYGDNPLRIGDRGKRALGPEEPSPKYRRLRERADYPEILAALAAYVRTCLVAPHTTEQRLWIATCMPDTWPSSFHQRLAAITVNNVETLVIYEERGLLRSTWRTKLFVNLAAGTKLPLRLKRFQTVFPRSYVTCGPVEQLRSKGPCTVVPSLLSSPSVAAGARELALGLLNKGGSMQSRFHNHNLADDIFALLQKQEDEQRGSAP